MAWVLMIVGGLLVLFAIIGISSKKAAAEAGFKPKQAVSLIVFGAVLAVVGYGLKLDSVESPGLKAVLATIPQGQAHSWETGQLNDGVAVVVNGSAGYWVKDGVAYAVNGVAKNLSPDAAYAPSEISWNKLATSIK